MCYVLFSLTLSLAFTLGPLSSPFVFISPVRQWFAADKAASTGDARVSRVLQHVAPSFPSTGPLSLCARPIGGAYDIFVIVLPDTCPSVTTASSNKLPLNLFFSLYVYHVYRVHSSTWNFNAIFHQNIECALLDTYHIISAMWKTR